VELAVCSGVSAVEMGNVSTAETRRGYRTVGNVDERVDLFPMWEQAQRGLSPIHRAYYY